MRKNYVIRKDTFQKEYKVEVIRPCEALYTAIFGIRGDTLQHTDYSVILDIDTAFLNFLSPIQIKVILYRFGFTGEWYTLQQIGDILNLSRERVRQIEEKALRKMRLPSFSKRFKPKYLLGEKELTNELYDLQQSIKQIIFDGLEEYFLKHNTNKILEAVLKRNNITIQKGNAKSVSLHYIDDCELSSRAYHCLEHAGIETLEEFSEKSYEDMMKIRNLGRRGLDELIAKLKEYNIPFSEDISEHSSQVKSNKYISLSITFKDVNNNYKFVSMSKEELAKCVYDILISEFEYTHLIYNYEISIGLMYLLILKGYLFVEKVLEDEVTIKNELSAGGYSDYISEFDEFTIKVKDHFLNEKNPIISYYILENTTAKNIIKKKPCTYTELVECIADSEDSYNEKETFRRMCLYHKISVNIKESEKNDYYKEYLDAEVEDLDAVVEDQD